MKTIDETNSKPVQQRIPEKKRKSWYPTDKNPPLAGRKFSKESQVANWEIPYLTSLSGLKSLTGILTSGFLRIIVFFEIKKFLMHNYFMEILAPLRNHVSATQLHIAISQ